VEQPATAVATAAATSAFAKSRFTLPPAPSTSSR
jgi:hypothetical protein